MLNFPNSPAVGTEILAPNGTKWRWNGVAWMLLSSSGASDGAVIVKTAGVDTVSTSSAQVEIADLSHEFDSPGFADQWVVTMSADLETIGVQVTTVIYCYVDGVVIPTAMVYQPPSIAATSFQTRLVQQKTWTLSGLASGLHVVSWTVSVIGGSGTARVYQLHSQSTLQRVQ